MFIKNEMVKLESFNRFWDGYACWLKRTLNDHCKNASQCRDYESLSCINGQCKISFSFLKKFN